MAKKSSLKLGQTNLDTELDFDFDFDSIEGQVSKDMHKKRQPVMSAFKGTIKGAKSSTLKMANLQKFLKAALPREYGEVLDSAGTVTSEVSKLYNEAVREIKPKLQQMNREVDKLVPAEMKRSKSFIAKLKSIVGEESQTYTNATQDREAGLQNKLAEIFQVQAEQDQRQHAEARVEERLKNKVHASQFKTTFGLMNSINVNLTKLSNYNEKVNSAFQKKSLELQYRSYFVQQELLETTKKFFEVFKVQNEAIQINTALPDYVKLTKAESFKSLARQKFMSGGMNMFSNSAFVKRAMENLQRAGKQKISNIGSAFGSATMGLENANMARSMTEGMDVDHFAMGGEMVGSMIPEWLASKAGEKARKLMPKSLLAQLYRVNKYATNMEGSVNKLKNSKMAKWSIDDEMSGVGGRMKNKGRDILSSFLNILSGGGPDTKLDTGGGFKLSRGQTSFDNLAHKSLTQVIPGYLARIFRELQVLRSGNNNVQLTSFDFKSDKFMNQNQLRMGMERSLGKAAKSTYSEYRNDEAYKLIVGDKTLSKSAEKALKDKIFDASFSANGLDTDILKSSDFTKGLNQADAIEIQSVIAENLNPLDPNHLEKDMRISKASNEARNSIKDIRGEIQALYNAGYGQMLKQMGLVTIKGDEVSINMENYKKLARDGKLGKELSKRVKSRTSSAGLTSARQATTPSAAPVGATASGAKPTYTFKPNRSAAAGGGMGGEAIPILSGIHSNTDLIIQRLDALGQLSHGTPNLTMDSVKKYLASLKQGASDKMHGFGDFVSDQSQSLSSRIGGLARGNPKTLMGNVQNLAASAGSLLVGTIEKVTAGIGSGVKSAKDKVIDPAARGAKQAYDKHKDTVIDAGKSIFSSGLNLVGTVFDYAKKGLSDLITSKLPAGYAQLAKGLGWLKQKVTNLLDEPTDVYVKGRRSPALQAILMRAGAYFDQATGKVIKNPSDIKGPVVNSDGEVVLSLDDMKRGIMNINGQPFKSITRKLLNFGMGVAGSAFGAAKEAFSALTKAGGNLGDTLKGMFGKVKDKLGGGFGFGFGKQVSLLTEIRDLLNTRLPGKRTRFKSNKSAGGAQSQPVSENRDTDQSSGGGFFGGLKEKAAGVKNWFGNLFGKNKGSGNRYSQVGGQAGGNDYRPDQAKAKRAGNADDMLKARQDKADSDRKNRTKVEASLDPRYKSSKNVFDTMAEKAAGAYNTIKDGLSSIADIAGMGGRRGRGGLLRRGARGLMRAPGAIGRGLMTAGSLIPGAAKVGRALTVGRTALMAGSMLLPGAGGAISGGLALIGSALASPWVLGAAAIAVTGYGLYKGYKFMTRNKISPLTRIRMLQYGIGEKNDSFYHQALKLEAYLEKTGLSFQNGQAQLNHSKLDFKEIAGIFNVDTEDTGPLQNFSTWLAQRFKPVFLTNETALFAANSKSKLDDIDDLKPAQIEKYLSGLTGLTEAYAVTSTPFQDQEPLNVGAKEVESAINDIRTENNKELDAEKNPSTFRKVVNFFTHNEALDKAASEGGVKGALAKIAKYVPGVVIGLNAFDAVKSGVSKMVSTVGKLIRPFFTGPPSAFESVRFKTYGLKASNTFKISALRDLEDIMKKYITITGAQAKFTGDIPTILKEAGDSFGVSSVEDDKAKNWVNWFQNRFLPTFLNFVGSGFGLIGTAEAAQIENRLNAQQRYELAVRISGTDVWNVKETPWADNPEICKSNEDCADNLAFLKEKVKQQEVKEQALKANNTIPNQKIAMQAKPVEFKKPEFTDTFSAPAPSGEAENTSLGKDQAQPESTTIRGGSVPVATGALADPSSGDQYIKFAKNISMNGIHPEMAKNFRAMAAEYGQLTGKSITVNSAYRSYEQQDALYKKDPSKASKPGGSSHERGLAMDVQSSDLAELEKLGLMRKYGFTRPVGGEPWHIEPAGIQKAFDLAKKDPNEASKMIADSLGRGGGGHGSIPGSKLGTRNPTLALSLLNQDAPVKTVDNSVPATTKDKAVAVLADSGKTYNNYTKVASNGVGPYNMPTTTPSGGIGTISGGNAANDSYSAAKSGPESEGKQLGKSFGYTPSNTGGSPGGTGGGASGSPSSTQDVKALINAAAKQAGVDPGTLTTFAALESGFRTGVKAGGTSATGLFQFVDKTWNYVVSKYGSKYGIAPGTPATDPRANTLMAAEYMKENAKAISRTRPNPNAGDLYTAHFLGPAGANKLFSSDPNASAVALFPESAAKNKPIFYNTNGQPRTIGEVQQFLQQKVQVAAQKQGVPLSPSGGTQLAGTPSTTTPPTTAAPTSIVSQQTQGRLAVNNVGPSANDASYGQPPRTTAPSTYVAPDVVPPGPSSGTSTATLTGVPPTVPGARAGFTPRIVESSQSYGATRAASPIDDIGITLTKSLGVQSEMLGVLKQISASMSPEQFKALIQSANANANAPKAAASTAVNLERKTG